MLDLKRDDSDRRDATDLMSSYEQYFTANSNAVRGRQDVSSFVIYTAYDNSIQATYSDSSIPKLARIHA